MNTPSKKIPVGILGATGMVGQRLLTLLHNHPWFDVVCLAASEHSAGKSYAQAVADRWMMSTPIPPHIAETIVLNVEQDLKKITGQVRCVFSAIDADKAWIARIEESYAAQDVAVVSNNSAHRWTRDVPMLIPEINMEHLAMIETQRKHRGWTHGLIVTKPNCSIQSYVPILHAWNAFEPEEVIVTTFQAISGAGKTFTSWPEMVDNVIPFISGEEEKSEREPLKILATVKDNQFVPSDHLRISASCIRVPVSDGHLASMHVRFKKHPDREALVHAIRTFQNPIASLNLPSAPNPFLTYFEEENRPQTKLDRDREQGMGVSVGRLREDPILGWKCIGLSHNTLRGAAGGGVLNAELLLKLGFIQP